MNMTDRIDKKMDMLRVIRDVAEKLPDVEWSSCIYDTGTISVHSMVELHELRVRLRTVLGSWNDKLKTIWACGCSGLASFNNPDVPVQIWLQTPIDEFPPELMGDGCGFAKIQRREEYSYICKANT